jgi:hypothetical protein
MNEAGDAFETSSSGSQYGSVRRRQLINNYIREILHSDKHCKFLKSSTGGLL